MKKIVWLLVWFSLSACMALDENEQRVVVSIPQIKEKLPEVASNSKLPTGSKVFVIYAEERKVTTTTSVGATTNGRGSSNSYLKLPELYGRLERDLIKKGFRPVLANLINNDNLYMDSNLMLDRVASLGKSVNAEYTLLIRDAYVGYNAPIAWAKARGCNEVYVSPMLAYVDAVVLRNSTGEIMTSFSYDVTNMANSYNSREGTLYHYSRYEYYDYVEKRGFNLGNKWPSCEYGVDVDQSMPIDNLCWYHSDLNDCRIPQPAFDAYLKEMLGKLLSNI